MANTGKAVGILVASMLGALILAIFGDMLVYAEGANESIGFVEGSSGATLVNYAPLIIVALGFYGAFQEFTDE